jgi:uncharacterized protein (TIGR02145 family)
VFLHVRKFFSFFFFNFYVHFIKGVVMNYKKIFNVVGVVAVSAVFIGCSEKSDDDGGGKGNDISKYKTVTIGTQTWMAENLDYAISGSVCYDNDPSNCEKYGRLYTWDAAQKACPAGWHLPSNNEWTILTNFAGGESTAGTKLKAANGWYYNIDEDDIVDGSGTDNYGFSALPGGAGIGSVYFIHIGSSGNWWSASAQDADDAWLWAIFAGDECVDSEYEGKDGQLSVRCVKN